MDYLKGVKFIEESFLYHLLKDKNITDISYNGRSIYYLHNLYGRQVSDIEIDEDDAKGFVRQLANIGEKQFSIQSPILDITIGKYRINAVHNIIAKSQNEGVINFSIRIASDELKIKKDSNFFPPVVGELFDILLKNQMSIVMGGKTGTGKTEFQKYLISRLPKKARVLIIDNVLELDISNLFQDLDINIWQSDESNTTMCINSLVKNALRSNPDWLIVAESRGKEMLEVLNSAMTGHPILTTIHSMDAQSMPNRIIRMVMMNDKDLSYKSIKSDILSHLNFYVYLKNDWDEEGKSYRHVQEVIEVDEKGNKVSLYKYDKSGPKFEKLSKRALKIMNFDGASEQFKEIFLKEELDEK